jgi:hypothetical protein
MPRRTFRQDIRPDFDYYPFCLIEIPHFSPQSKPFCLATEVTETTENCNHRLRRFHGFFDNARLGDIIQNSEDMAFYIIKEMSMLSLSSGDSNLLGAIALIGGIILVLWLLWLSEENNAKERLMPYKDAWIKFFEESEPSCPKDKGYPEATLYRHLWRRAVVLQAHIAQTEEEKQILKNIQEIAARNYYSCAPRNAYGKVRLRITPNQVFEYLKREQSQTKDTNHWDTKKFTCVYVGMTKDGKMYVGKTVNEPEKRWVEHRKTSTGPFKNGNDYAEWSVVRGNVQPKELDYWEAYYIGYYNTYEEGYNENPGTDKTAYDRGRNDARDKVANGEDGA